jgi:hypothetical protein
MKTFKIILLILSFMVVKTGVSLAQDKATNKTKSVEERTDNIMKELSAKLTLTADQTPKIKALVTQSLKDRDADRETYKDNKEKLAVAKKERETKTDAEVKEILTKDQYKTYLEWKKEKAAAKDNRAKEAAPKK